MKVTRREIYSTSLVLALTVAVVASFPFASIRFRSVAVRPVSTASAAFVILTEDERVAALKAAKTAWQSDASEARGLRIRLPLGELPEEKQGALLGARELSCGTIAAEPLPARLPPWAVSLRAAAPVRLASEPEAKPAPAFSREELLKIR